MDEREGYRTFLRQLPEGSQIALEACGFWYWTVDEIERPGIGRGWRIRRNRRS